MYKIIKIPGKSFEDLSLNELALMIEADSSISPDGNDYFASCALDEFLHNVDLKREDLRRLQQEILAHIYIDIEGSQEKRINREYLVSLASKLRTAE